MKKLLVAGACLGALAGAAQAQAGPPDLVVVRIYEGDVKIHVSITRGQNTSEVLEFDNGTSDKNLTRSGQGYYQLFQRFYQEGYVLQSTFSAAKNRNSTVTLPFTRKP